MITLGILILGMILGMVLRGAVKAAIFIGLVVGALFFAHTSFGLDWHGILAVTTRWLRAAGAVLHLS